MNKQSANIQLIKEYYAAYEKKDWSILQRILAANFTFTSPAGDDHIDMETYKEKCWPNALNTQRFDLEVVFADDTSGLATYNGYTTGNKLFRNTELFKFKDGKIISNECFFGSGVNFPNNAEN
jgi:ketosteroid isomerase-like protein